MSSLVSCFLGNDRTAAKEISKRIEQQIKDDKKIARTQVKLLVLGTSESGKSTFLKQMRIIHGTGYTADEKRSFIGLICQNVHTSMKILLQSMKNLNIEYDLEENSNIAMALDDGERDESRLPKSLALDFMKLWNDGGIQQCYARRNEFQLSDSTLYFMSNLDQISEEDYIPSLQDILRSRMPTTGIREYQFTIGNFVFGIVDVGGQKSERRKWIHCFENVTSIIFLARLSEYDLTIPLEEVSQDLRASLRHRQQRALQSRGKTVKGGLNYSGSGSAMNNGLAELDLSNGNNPHSTQRKLRTRPSNKKNFVATEFPRTPVIPRMSSKNSPDQNGNTRKHDSSSRQDEAYARSHINRMKESRALFKTIISCEYFINTSVILFLNKKDILAEKIHTSHLVDHFPEFDGPRADAESARAFILTKYADCFERSERQREICTPIHVSTDTRNIRYVFAAVKDIILKNYLVTYNLV
uniref:G protein alpha subunit x class n=1 Tax=Halocynthia roretzi TaxID=7729 RepID=Q8WPA0_HALRO|nr:G protein alpha subunit x class [Halocynthia roretzi]BAB79201.1 G protein alpha subunit x class [Halocynthia roretzi]